jgi:phenylacetate-CoA ligase
MFNNARAMFHVMNEAKLHRLELDKLVYRRLRAILVSAYLNVPYYRELMKNVGYDPSQDYQGPEDLSKLPITKKEIIKQRKVRDFIMQNKDLSGCLRDTTSGSTGIPLVVYRTRYERAFQIAKFLRILFLNGYSMSNKVMSLTRPDKLTEGRSVVQRFGFLRRNAIDFLRYSPEEMVDILIEYKPDVLYGNRAHLELMALELQRRGIQCDSLKIVLTTGEAIHENTRRLCQKKFGVDPVETYGSIEMGIMGYETPAHDGLHLYENLTYFEFLDEEEKPVPPGKPGRVIVTDLIGKLMPFIRYDQGDFAAFEYGKDLNGNTQRRLTQTIGRENDYALLPDGTKRPYNDLVKIVDKFEDIRQFRIVQQKRSLFQILIVADTSYFLSIHDDLMRLLQRKFPPNVSFKIAQVEKIEPDPSGKMRAFVSEVDRISDKVPGEISVKG